MNQKFFELLSRTAYEENKIDEFDGEVSIEKQMNYNHNNTVMDSFAIPRYHDDLRNSNNFYNCDEHEIEINKLKHENRKLADTIDYLKHQCDNYEDANMQMSNDIKIQASQMER